MTANSKYIYYANGDNLYFANGWNSTDGFTLDGVKTSATDLKCNQIYSMAAAGDALLIGTTAGIKNVYFKSDDPSDPTFGIPNSSTSDFSSKNNAATILNANYTIYSIFVLDPEMNEDDTDTYAAMTIRGSLSNTSGLFKETGLYAYYPDRGYWNRDGTANNKTSGN